MQEGYNPIAGLLVGRDGLLYGTTTNGGEYGDGTLFKISLPGKMTVIHHFRRAEGKAPVCALAQGAGSDNHLYRACALGGSNDAGSIFSIDVTGGDFRVIHTFDGTSGGKYPTCTPFPDGNGHLYGTTARGGTDSVGIVWKLNTSGAVFTRLFDFRSDNLPSDDFRGNLPDSNGSMVVRNGYLYGIAPKAGHDNGGMVFRINMKTDATSTFHLFNDTIQEGSNPIGGLSFDGGSKAFYGVCSANGKNHAGTAYSLDMTTGAYTLLYAFLDADPHDGINPYSLILGRDGSLYGITQHGGSGGAGTILKIPMLAKPSHR